jgi:uncharacterized membrane protein
LPARWVLVFAVFLWVGITFFFLCHAARLPPPEAAAKAGVKPQVWMVHSGGFYIVEKQRVPELMPSKLHWFRWEAFVTAVTGILLLGIVYYWGGLTVDYGSKLSNGAAIGIGVALLVGAWFAYDLLWLSPIGKNEAAGVAICYAALVALSYGLTHLFSPRAGYMHVGAVMGTIMATNVWVRILPAQRALIAACEAGRAPDLTLAERAKKRSKQNTFMAVPVVFIMLSNHFPTATYGHDWNWVILSALILVGWGAAKIIREH